ncbi:hypothetical protein WJX73_006798 [Symbiochloris irregularis]|uniref:Uncharacterized protein n=1 Tax=Symbiochloris irregularis TaxID=706552 RepID=A0AAW1PMU8_9CHLO
MVANKPKHVKHQHGRYGNKHKRRRAACGLSDSKHSVVQFSQLVPQESGQHQLPISVHLHLRELWRAGLAELQNFPSIVEKLQRQVITWRLVCQLWFKVFKHFITYSLYPSHATTPSKPVLVCGNTQAEKTCLDAVIRILIEQLPHHTAVLHTIVVNPRQAPDHARKLNSYLQSGRSGGPGAHVVACNATFDSTYPALCDHNIWVVERRATHLKHLTAQIHAYANKPGSSAIHILQHDEADDGQGMHDRTQYVQALATLAGFPQGEWRQPGSVPPQLMHPLRLLTTATPLPCVLELHDQDPPCTLNAEDVIWLDPSPEYGGVTSMYRTLRHPVDGISCHIPPNSPQPENHYLLYPEGKMWLDDLVKTPAGYGVALNTDKVVKEGGISGGAAAA